MHIALHFLSAIVAAISLVDALEDDPMMKRALVEARQTNGLPNLEPSCTSALKGLVDTLPTPPPDLITAFGGGQNDPCTATVPDTLSSDFSSYSSEVGSWFTQHSQSISSALSKCHVLSQYATKLPVCATSYLGGGGHTSGTHTHTPATATGATTTGTGTTASPTTTTGTETTGTTTTGATTATTTGAAVRETGVAFAGLAVAGLIALAL
ncbi:hypothetical protein ACO1O0_008503 [Amphichorda felina]